MKNLKRIKSNIKDSTLVNRRRIQIAETSVELFVKKGYHQTTVREIARSSGMSMGALYDYIRTKEDILFLVCDHIHSTVSRKLKETLFEEKNALDNLKDAIREYFKIIDEIQNYMILLYQETKSLNKKARKYIFKAEEELIGIFKSILNRCIEEKSIVLDKSDVNLVAHNIMVTGQMWAFRRWALSRDFSLNRYIKIQTELLLHGIIQSPED